MEPKPVTQSEEREDVPKRANNNEETDRAVDDQTERLIEDSIEVQEANASRLYTDAIALFRAGSLGSEQWKTSREKLVQVLNMKLLKSDSKSEDDAIEQDIKVYVKYPRFSASLAISTISILTL